MVSDLADAGVDRFQQLLVDQLREHEVVRLGNRRQQVPVERVVTHQRHHIPS